MKPRFHSLILAALGLTDTATTEDILAAITALQEAAAPKPEPQPEPEPEPQPEPQPDKTEEELEKMKAKVASAAVLARRIRGGFQGCCKSVSAALKTSSKGSNFRGFWLKLRRVFSILLRPFSISLADLRRFIRVGVMAFWGW